MKELLFYHDPVLLNSEEHRALRFTPTSNYSFSADINSVPLLAVEFFEASRDMPILFAKDVDAQYYPLALLSLKNGGNDCTDGAGRWITRHIPAFVRRYPFALTPDRNVCFDRSATHFSDDAGEPLFAEDGNQSKTLQGIVAFLAEYDAEHARTRTFCDAVCAAGMFKPFTLQIITADKSAVRLDGLFTIDEAALLQLADDKISEWLRKGYIAWIYAHLHSMGALRLLTDKLDTRAK